jgi:hypothetical protein
MRGHYVGRVLFDRNVKGIERRSYLRVMAYNVQNNKLRGP